MMRIGTCGAARQTCSKVAIPWLSGSHRSSRIAATPFTRSRSIPSSSRGAHSSMNESFWSLASASRTDRPSEGSSPIRRMRIAFALIEGPLRLGFHEYAEPRETARERQLGFLVELFRGLRGVEGFPVELRFDPDRA